MIPAAPALLMVVALLEPAAGSLVRERGQSEGVPARAAGPGGVTALKPLVVLRGGSLTQDVVISWDRVAGIEGPLKEQARAYERPAEDLWRARARIERGDAIAAGPLLRELEASGIFSAPPTSSVLRECVLRCELALGPHASAAASWLRWLDGSPAAGGMLEGVVDPATFLVPELPPMFLDSAQTREILAHLRSFNATTPRAQALRTLYERAAAFEVEHIAATVDLGELESSDDAGVALVREIALSRIGGPSKRREAREALRQRLEAPGQSLWTWAWCTAAVGRSLVLEEKKDDQRLGVVTLLRVVALEESARTPLKGVALSDAIATLRRLGDDQAALALASLPLSSLDQQDVTSVPKPLPILPE